MNIFFDKIIDFLFFSNGKLFSFKDLKKRKEIRKLFSTFNNYNSNIEIKYVGGCVRKILNKEEIDDIDFAVNLNPEQMKELLKVHNIKFVETGIKHGTITVIINKFKFEITSLRKDVNTYGRHADVEFSLDWKEDASRRDFTINSIYSDIDGKLYDPFEGKNDLEIGNIKFIGNADERIKEDYLRILRYIRFFINYSKHNHDPSIKKIINQNLDGISKISSERLLDEFKKITYSSNFLKLFKDEFCLNLIKLIFPQFKNIELFVDLNDIAQKKTKEIDFTMILSLLLIDGSDNVEYFLYKFNLSNNDKNRILFLNKNLSKILNNDFLSKNNLWKVYYQYGKKYLYDLINFQIFSSKKNSKKLNEILDFFKDKEIPLFPITARYLIKKYNMEEGKILGSKLKKMEEIWLNNKFEITEKEITKIIES